MVIIAIALSIVLIFIFRNRKRHLEENGGKRLAYHFFDKSLDFLIPFAIVGSLFLLLSLFVANTSDQTTVSRLMFLEKTAGFFKWFVSLFKVSALAAMGLLLIFYLLSLMRIPSRYTGRFVPFFKKYQKIVKTASIIAIILFSFTFFGTQTGEISTRLRFRINEAEGHFGELREETQDAISQAVARKLLEKIKNDLPPEYKRDYDEQNNYYTNSSSLRSQYISFKSSYKQSDRFAENISKDTPPPDPPPSPRKGGGGGNGGGGNDKPKAGERSLYELFEAGERPVAPPERAPQQASTAKINEAKASVRTFRTRLEAEAVKILQSEHGRELAIQVPKTFTGKLKDVVFKALTDRYPILEPILGTFVGTLDKVLEARTLRAADRVARVLAENPGGAIELVDQEASLVVKETQLKFPTSLTNKARRAVEVMRNKARTIKEAVTWLWNREQQIAQQSAAVEEERAAAREADEQIELLACNSEEMREEAANKLAKASKYLTQEQVERIETLMYDGDNRLRKSTAYPDRYEVVPVQYYAAKAVRGISSQHLSERAKELASNVIRTIDSARPDYKATLPASRVESSGLTAP
jgi:hypothetical protein